MLNFQSNFVSVFSFSIPPSLPPSLPWAVSVLPVVAVLGFECGEPDACRQLSALLSTGEAGA